MVNSVTASLTSLAVQCYSFWLSMPFFPLQFSDLSMLVLLCCVHCNSPATVIAREHLCSISVYISVFFFLSPSPPFKQSRCFRWFQQIIWDVLMNAFESCLDLMASSDVLCRDKKRSDILPLWVFVGMILYPAVCELWLVNLLKEEKCWSNTGCAEKVKFFWQVNDVLKIGCPLTVDRTMVQCSVYV